jgi:pimeloyl-ACP methyl ester carboxylesterase
MSGLPDVTAPSPSRASVSRRAARFVWLAWALLALASCGYVRIAKKHMPYTTFVEDGPARTRGAIVLLPGFGDTPSTFAEQGFVDKLRSAAPTFDVFAADAHFGYYRRRTLIERLEGDVISPLRRRGYRELWLVGASMGGHGAIAYARMHPQDVTGLILLAPYMGPRDVVAEVQRAGGLCKYEAAPYEESADGFARENFAWLRRMVCDEQRLSIWLGVGDGDRLLPADRLLADALAPEHVLVLPGGHGWEVWTPAIEQLAARALPP